jgi:hypothetical protein
MQFIPRSVYFDHNGKCIGAGFSAVEREAATTKIMLLPTDHYDFLGPIQVKGKSEAEIIEEASQFHGNEDCPRQVDLYKSKNPQLGDTVVRFIYDAEEELYEQVLD